MQISYMQQLDQKLHRLKQIKSEEQSVVETEEDSDGVDHEKEKVQSVEVSSDLDENQMINSEVLNNVSNHLETNGNIPNDLTLGPTDGQVQSLKVELDSQDVDESSVEPKEPSQNDCDIDYCVDAAEIRAIYSAIENETCLLDPFQMSKELFQSVSELALLCLQHETYGEPIESFHPPFTNEFKVPSQTENDTDLSDNTIGRAGW